MLKNLLILTLLIVNIWLVSGDRLGQCSYVLFKSSLQCSAQNYEMQQVLGECGQALLTSPTKVEFKEINDQLRQCSVESIETYKELKQCRKLLATVCNQHTF